MMAVTIQQARRSKCRWWRPCFVYGSRFPQKSSSNNYPRWETTSSSPHHVVNEEMRSSERRSCRCVEVGITSQRQYVPLHSQVQESSAAQSLALVSYPTDLNQEPNPSSLRVSSRRTPASSWTNEKLCARKKSIASPS